MNLAGPSARSLLQRATTPVTLMVAVVVLIGLFRVATLGTLALTDNTEARYADISWQMFRSGDWVTPRLYVDGKLMPFWAKPPMFFWLTALSYEMAGVSEWAARLPNLLIALAVVAGTIAVGRRLWGPREGALAGLILASSGLFFILSGTCVLDMALAASVSLAMLSFALFAANPTASAGWGRLFFFALGLGCLAKGPVALALVGLALAPWIALTSQWRLIRQLPWVTGTMIAAIVAVPWYVLAERATPGFLRYFLINEHILRYIRTDYGDLYGNGRTQPYGASWVMLLVAFLPWSPLAIRYGIDRWLGRREPNKPPRDVWILYMLIWGLTPAAFFTLCRQILVTYLLPGFPGLALVTAVLIFRWIDSGNVVSLVRGLRAYCLVLGLLLLAGLGMQLATDARSATVVAWLAATVLFAAIAWSGHARGEPIRLLAAIGLGSPLIVAIALVASAPWIDEMFSTKTILLAIARSPQNTDRPVMFPLADENSADFYQEACLRRHLEHPAGDGLNILASKLQQPDHELYVFRRKAWLEIDSEVRGRLLPSAETAHWVACRLGNLASPAATTGATPGAIAVSRAPQPVPH